MAMIDDVNGAVTDELDQRVQDENDKVNDQEIVDGVNECCDDDKDDYHDLYMVLNSMRINLEQLASNCCSVHDKINHIEMDCIDLLQPMGDVISLERQLKQLSELGSNFKEMFKNDDNN